MLNGVGNDVPDNSVGVFVGSYMLTHTPGDVIKPGVWQHVAVELEIERLPNELESGKSKRKASKNRISKGKNHRNSRRERITV